LRQSPHWIRQKVYFDGGQASGLELASDIRDMKPLAIVIALGMLYGYAAMKTKSFFEGPARIAICKYAIAHRGCDVLAWMGDP
jgi:hypothetical protein